MSNKTYSTEWHCIGYEPTYENSQTSFSNNDFWIKTEAMEIPGVGALVQTERYYPKPNLTHISSPAFVPGVKLMEVDTDDEWISHKLVKINNY